MISTLSDFLEYTADIGSHEREVHAEVTHSGKFSILAYLPYLPRTQTVIGDLIAIQLFLMIRARLRGLSLGNWERKYIGYENRASSCLRFDFSFRFPRGFTAVTVGSQTPLF